MASTDIVVQGAELVPTNTLFGTDNPGEVVARAAQVATTLANLVRQQNLIVKIGQSDHVRVEGWTLLGSMLGVFPVVTWTRQILQEEQPWGWEARVEARTRAGEIVGAAEAECLRSEPPWSYQPPLNKWGKVPPVRDDYALRSMAQTRAVSKALRLPLGFVMQLAGFDPTPADEMPVWEKKSSGEPQAAGTVQAPVSQPTPAVGEAASPDDGSAPGVSGTPTQSGVAPAGNDGGTGAEQGSAGEPSPDIPASASLLADDAAATGAEGISGESAPPSPADEIHAAAEALEPAEPGEAPWDEAPPQVKYITKKQRDRLFAIASSVNVPLDTVREIVVAHTGQESTKLIPAGATYDAVVAAIEAAEGDTT